MAPSASHVTALEKDGGADAGAIMKGELLYIKYRSCDHTASFSGLRETNGAF
jgi:hypothetical protein